MDLPFLPTFTDFQFKTKTRINTQNEISFLGFGAIDDFKLNKNDTYQQDYKYNTPVQIFYNSRLSFIKCGIFASAGVPIISKRINLSMSFRMDANSYSNNMNNMLKQFSPRFSASAQLTTPLFFNFNLGRYYQLPSLTTMGYRDNNLKLTNKNNELKYIHADHVVARFEYSTYNQKRQANFHQLDIRVDKKYNFKNWSLGIYFDIQNLYNHKINEPVKYVQQLDNTGAPIIANPNDDITAQRYQFDKIITQNGTVLPTLGIIVEF